MRNLLRDLLFALSIVVLMVVGVVVAIFYHEVWEASR